MILKDLQKTVLLHEHGCDEPKYSVQLSVLNYRRNAFEIDDATSNEIENMLTVNTHIEGRPIQGCELFQHDRHGDIVVKIGNERRQSIAEIAVWLERQRSGLRQELSHFRDFGFFALPGVAHHLAEVVGVEHPCVEAEA